MISMDSISSLIDTSKNRLKYITVRYLIKSGKFPAEFLKQYFFGFFRGRTDAGL